MAIDYGWKTVGFACNTASGNQTISLSGGPGKTPKLVMLFLSRATALDTITASALQSVGAYDGTNKMCVAAMAENGNLAVNTDTGGRIDTGAVLQITGSSSEGKEGRATPVSLGTDQIVINWATGEVPASAYRGMALFFYGADMQAGVLHLKSSASLNGTVATTTPGVTPDGVIVVNVGQDFAADTGFSVARLCVGFAGRSSAGNASSAVTGEDDLNVSTSSGCLTRDDACATKITGTSGTVAEDSRVKVDTFDAQGFTIKSLVASALDAMYVWFRIAGRSVYVGAPSLAANVSGNTTDTTPGFLGGLAMFSACKIASADSVSSANGALSVGVATPTDQGCVAFDDRDNQSNGSTQSLTSAANAVDVVDAATTHDWTADFAGFTATGYTYHVTDTAGAARPTAVMIAQAPPVDLAPTGIASAEAFGTPTVSATIALSPTGIASAEAFGTPTVSATITVLPTGIASAEAFGTPTVSTTITLSPTGIASAEAFGTPAVSATITLSPTGIASAEAFGTAIVSVQGGPQFVGAQSIPSAEAFGAPTVSATIALSPTGIASAEAFGIPAVSATISLSPTGIASAEAFGTPTVSQTGGLQVVSPIGIPSAQAFGVPTVSQTGSSTVTVLVFGIPSAEAFGIPFVRGGRIPVTLKKLIHDALCSRAHLGTFIAATYPVADEGCVLEQGLQVAPRSVEVNEVRGTSAEARTFRTFEALDKVRWRWEMILRFDQEVIAELFEASLDADPVLVCRDRSDPDARQARLSRVDCDYRHPPRGSPSNGTELRYAFEATLSPR